MKKIAFIIPLLSFFFLFHTSAYADPLVGNFNGGVALVRSPYHDFATISDTDPNATSWTATADYGDGSGTQNVSVSGNTISLNHTYNSPGTYPISINVTNNLGETGTKNTTVTVNPSFIQVNVTSSTAQNLTLGDTFSQNIAFNDQDPAATSWTATVDYGDGSGTQQVPLNPDNTFSVSHVYSNAGGYTININITNNFGESGSISEGVAINPPFTATNVSFDSTTHILSFTTNADWSTACLKGNCGAKYFWILDSNYGQVYFTLWYPNICWGNGQCHIPLPDFDPNTLETSQFHIQIQLFNTLPGGNVKRFDSQLLPSSIFASSVNLTGTVYNDDNQNGIQDNGEDSYQGATVTLSSGSDIIATTTTDTNGNYTFSNLSPGTYTEAITVPNGYTATTANPVSLSISTNTTQNFGIFSAPVVGAVTVSPNTIQINTAVTATATFTDGDTTDTHTATANWGDGTNTAVSCSVTEPNGSTPGSVSCPLSAGYTAANVYPVTITVSDDENVQGTSAVTYESVYSPTQSSIFTAGANYSNPSSASPSTSGIVRFGLSYKYQGTMVNGDNPLSLKFSAAGITFSADTVTSLVISNGIAILQGTGTYNGTSGYHFIVTGVNQGGIRIQITDPSNKVMYDTQPGDSITATPTTSVNGNVKVQ